MTDILIYARDNSRAASIHINGTLDTIDEAKAFLEGLKRVYRDTQPTDAYKVRVDDGNPQTAVLHYNLESFQRLVDYKVRWSFSTGLMRLFHMNPAVTKDINGVKVRLNHNDHFLVRNGTVMNTAPRRRPGFYYMDPILVDIQVDQARVLYFRGGGQTVAVQVVPNTDESNWTRVQVVRHGHQLINGGGSHVFHLEMSTDGVNFHKIGPPIYVRGRAKRTTPRPSTL